MNELEVIAKCQHPGCVNKLYLGHDFRYKSCEESFEKDDAEYLKKKQQYLDQSLSENGWASSTDCADHYFDLHDLPQTLTKILDKRDVLHLLRGINPQYVVDVNLDVELLWAKYQEMKNAI